MSEPADTVRYSFCFFGYVRSLTQPKIMLSLDLSCSEP
jgi:hypothetical protein